MAAAETRKSLASIPALALVLLAGLAPPLRADEKAGGRRCSLRSLDGSYGFYRAGITPAGATLAGAGIVHFDGSGNWYATVSNVRNGEVSLDEEFSGTYDVAPDCTGSLFIGEDETERIVIVDDGRSYYALNVTGGPTISTVAARIQSGRGGDHSH